jgi:hypothetical protein
MRGCGTTYLTAAACRTLECLTWWPLQTYARQSSCTSYASPLKVFQYLILGKPVLIASAKPAANLVEQVGCGVVVPGSGSAEPSE